MELANFKSEATRVLSEIRKGSTFLTVHNYLNNFGEVSDFSVVFHINYRNSVAKSFELLEKYRPKKNDTIGRQYNLDELSSARIDLLDSFKRTLNGSSRSMTENVYSFVNDGNGDPIDGVKLHKKQDVLHLNGFKVHKKVISDGFYSIDNRSSRAVAMAELKSKLPIGRYSQFKLTPGKFTKLVVSGITLLEEDVVRNAMNKNLN